MLTPEYLKRVIEATEQKVADVNSYLTSRTAKRIVELFEQTGEVALIPASIHDIMKQEVAGKLFEEIQAEVEKQLPDIQKEVRSAFQDAAGKIARDNAMFTKEVIEFEHKNGNLMDVELPEITELEKIGIPDSAKNLHMTPKEIRFLESAYRRTKGEIYNITRTTASSAQKAFIDACDTAYFKIAHGVNSNTAIMEAIDEVAKKGITTVFYGSRKDKLEVAIARAVRTGINQANGDITLCRCAEMGVGYVKTSQHIGARVTDKDDYTNHSLWQGKVYKLDWKHPKLSKYEPTEAEIKENKRSFSFLQKIKQFFMRKKAKEYPDFMKECGYGEMLGICGINCRHSFGPFYPEININTDKPIDTEKNKKRYELEQKQRSMERAIRQTKRRKDALEAAGLENEESKTKQRELENLLAKQSKSYREFCKKNKLPQENWRIKVAKELGTSNGLHKTEIYGAWNDSNDPLGEKRDTHAKLYYEELRNRKRDIVINTIAQNTGLRKKAIETVYTHVFENEHRFLDGRMEGFVPDYEMAQSFQRLLEGVDIKEHDLVLLKHEWLEHWLMKKYNMVYEEAHAITERKYNYAIALKKYKRGE